jgi:hypothetical protein
MPELISLANQSSSVRSWSLSVGVCVWVSWVRVENETHRKSSMYFLHAGPSNELTVSLFIYFDGLCCPFSVPRRIEPQANFNTADVITESHYLFDVICHSIMRSLTYSRASFRLHLIIPIWRGKVSCMCRNNRPAARLHGLRGNALTRYIGMHNNNQLTLFQCQTFFCE